MSKKLQEIIDFFELEEGYNRQEVIADIIGEIEGLKGIEVNEIVIEYDGEIILILDEFVDEFYDKLIEKVCNVIKSFKK